MYFCFMRKTVFILMLAVMSATVYGRTAGRVVERVVRPSCELASGDTLWLPTDTLGASLVEVRCIGRKWRVAYDIDSVGRACYLGVAPASEFMDADIGGKMRMESGEAVAGCDSVAFEQVMPSHDEAVSLVVDVAGGHADCYAGSRGVGYMCTSSAGSLGRSCIVAEAPLKVMDIILERAHRAMPVSVAVTADSISADPLAGEWYYLDRQNDPDKVRLGGEYRLRIQQADGMTASGKYDIVYVGGAKVNASEWKPAMMKGTLEATQFKGRYNLKWYDAEFNLMERDLRAEYDAAARVLTLYFPIHKAVLRFARQ